MFALATVALPRGHSVAALRVDGPQGPSYWPLPAAGLSANAMDLFHDWNKSFSLLGRFKKRGKAIPEGKAKLLTPLRYPRKLFCVGANYADHLAEMNAKIDKLPGRPPFFFMKPPSTTLVGPGKTVRIPPGCEHFDWEVEFVVVFGKGGRNIRENDAMKHVAGYSVGIDFTARDLFYREDRFFKFDFVLGKCQDTTTPVGPTVVPKQFLDGTQANFGLWVNGIRKQTGNTKDMIYSLPEQIAGVSRAVTIEPGDMMFTGSPAGVGLPRGEKLAPGDRVRIEADIIGSMEVVIQ